MNIAVIGTGYVGLVVGTCFAESGNEVICLDIDVKKIQNLRRGIVPIYEPGLEELVKRNLKNKRLFFTTNLKEAIKRSQIFFFALPTPTRKDGSADLRALYNVVRAIAQMMKEPKIFVTKSTVPAGTSDKLRQLIRAETEIAFDVVANPEFLKQGAAVNDFLYPQRVIVGTRNEQSATIMHELYAPFMRTSDRFLLMDERSAELSKYAANAFLATKISFMNEIANLCSRVGADVDWIRRGIGMDSRIGPQFLFPGVGYGGSCFPKDVKALIHTAKEHGYKFKILQAVDQVNTSQQMLIVEQLKKYFGGELKGKTIAIWGLSFKPRTDDIRDAPSIVIISRLLKAGAKVQAHDPVANENVRKVFGKKIKLFDNDYDALKNAHALILVTEWNEFRRPDFGRMKQLMKTPVVFDGRNIYDSKLTREHGFTYFGIGR